MKKEVDIKEIKIGFRCGCLTVTDIVDGAKDYAHLVESISQKKKTNTADRNLDLVLDYSEYTKYEKDTNLYICKCKCGKIYELKRGELLAKRHKYCDLIDGVNRLTETHKLYCMAEGKDYLDGFCGLRKKERDKQFSEAIRVKDKYYDLKLNKTVHETLRITGPGDDIETFFKCKGRIKEARVSKTYKCVCQMCGTQYQFRYEDFFINKDYGYYSRAHCNCHEISSFQWRTIKIFEENNIEYQAEVSFDGLMGYYGINHLRFDFGIYKNGELRALVECQGEQHYNADLYGSTVLNVQKRNDDIKRKYITEEKIPLIEIPYTYKTKEKEEKYIIEQLSKFL